MHGCHKITGRDACRGLHPRQPFKHVQYYILGFAVIPEQNAGQTNHPAVVLTKKPLKYLSVKHISLHSPDSGPPHNRPFSRKRHLFNPSRFHHLALLLRIAAKYPNMHDTCLLPILPPRNLKAHAEVNPQIGNHRRVKIVLGAVKRINQVPVITH